MAKVIPNNPYPVKLGTDLKQFLQAEAQKEDRSLHYWIIKILTAHKTLKERK